MTSEDKAFGRGALLASMLTCGLTAGIALLLAMWLRG